MLLTDKYADKIHGTITCYDRMIIQGYIPGWSYAEGMTSYLKANDIRIFDFSNFSQPLTEQIRQNAQRIADENENETPRSKLRGISPRLTSFVISLLRSKLRGIRPSF